MRTIVNCETGEVTVDPDWIGETQLPTLDDYRRAIQVHIDATANVRGYDSGVTCASYVSSTNAIWQAEAVAFVSKRDEWWAYAYAELAKVQNSEREQPSVAELIDELTPMVWPLAE